MLNPCHCALFSPASKVILMLAFLGTIIRRSSSLQSGFKEGNRTKHDFIGNPCFSGREFHINSHDFSHPPRRNSFIYPKPFKLWRVTTTDGSAVVAFNPNFGVKIPKDTSRHQSFSFILRSCPIVFEDGHEVLGQIKTIADGLEVNITNPKNKTPLFQFILFRGVQDVRAALVYDCKSKELKIDVSTLNFTSSFGSRLDLSEVFHKNVCVRFSASSNDSSESVITKSCYFSSEHKVSKKWIRSISISLPIVVGFTAIFSLLMIRLRSLITKRNMPCQDLESVLVDSTIVPHNFRLKQLRTATENFDPKNKLGQGGFGTVYRGSMNELRSEIAVKRVSKHSCQGRQQFVAEVTTFSCIRHKNLVKLFGWCCEEDELLLVYELLPKGSLDKLIFSKNENVLSWERRHAILTGVAFALSYLHDGCEMKVLHRDVKASNVMIDSEFNARLGDFGLARTVQRNGETHHSSTAIAGTPGYMAPEYYLTGRASVETDAYGFGVLVLEVVCGRRTGHLLSRHKSEFCNNSSSSSTCYSCGSIIDWVWELYGMGRLLEAVDCRLQGEYVAEQVVDVLRLGLACCHPNPHERPSMSMALQVLRAEVASPHPPCEKPAFIWPVITTFSGVIDFLRSNSESCG